MDFGSTPGVGQWSQHAGVGTSTPAAGIAPADARAPHPTGLERRQGPEVTPASRLHAGSHTSRQARPSRKPGWWSLRACFGRPGSESPETPSRFSADTLRRARQLYEGSVLKHGTNTHGLESLRTDGFQKELKDAGTEWPDRHFLTPDHAEADSRATFAAGGDPQHKAIARTVGVAEEIGVARERETRAVWTPEDIPPPHVLGSKRSPPDHNAPVFQRLFDRGGMHLPTEEAGELGREVQSDSDED